MVEINGATKIVVKGQSQTPALIVGVALVLVASIVGFCWIEVDARKSVRVPSRGIAPLGVETQMESYLVYTKAGEYPVRMDVPVSRMCRMMTLDPCQEVRCLIGGTVAQVCKGGYILKLGGR